MEDRQMPNLSPGIQAIVRGMLMYVSLAPGECLLISAEDARSGQESRLRVRFMGVHGIVGHDRQRAVFSVESADYNFFDVSGGLFGSVPEGTLCLGGLAMTWLPRPVYHMVGFGGIEGSGRDFSFDCVKTGDRLHTLIAHRIISISRIPGAGDFRQPNELMAYLDEVESMTEAVQNTAQAEQQQEEVDKSKLIQSLIERAGVLPCQLVNALEECGYSGVLAIVSFLFYAYEQEKFQVALSLIETGFDRQWNFQHPAIRADPEMGSNREYFEELYAQAGINRTPANLDTSIPKDEGLSELRDLLEKGPSGDDYVGRETLSLSEVSTGQIIILETVSRNRYVVRVDDPEQGIVTLMALKHRAGFPSDGVFHSVRCPNLEIGRCWATSALISSTIATIWVRKPGH